MKKGGKNTLIYSLETDAYWDENMVRIVERKL